MPEAELNPRGQNAQDQHRCDEFWRCFEYECKRRRDGDCDENGNREAVICQQCAQIKLLIGPRVTCPRAFSATRANLLLGVVGTRRAPTDAKRPVGVISLIGGYGGLHPL
jgi:hypothetical protein